MVVAFSNRMAVSCFNAASCLPPLNVPSPLQLPVRVTTLSYFSYPISHTHTPPDYSTSSKALLPTIPSFTMMVFPQPQCPLSRKHFSPCGLQTLWSKMTVSQGLPKTTRRSDIYAMIRSSSKTTIAK